MALPAGRRGIRANLVRSDGTIDNSSIEDEISDLEELIDAYHLEVTALSNRVGTIATNIAWTSPSETVASLSDFTDWVDQTVPAAGTRSGYLTVGIASAVGLTGVGHVFQILANSEKYRVVVAYSVDNSHIAMITKQNGTWKSAWKTVALS